MVLNERDSTLRKQASCVVQKHLHVKMHQSYCKSERSSQNCIQSLTEFYKVNFTNTGSASKYVFKFGRSDHIFGKKMTEKTHFGSFTLVIFKICQKICKKIYQKPVIKICQNIIQKICQKICSKNPSKKYVKICSNL